MKTYVLLTAFLPLWLSCIDATADNNLSGLQRRTRKPYEHMGYEFAIGAGCQQFDKAKDQCKSFYRIYAQWVRDQCFSGVDDYAVDQCGCCGHNCCGCCCGHCDPPIPEQECRDAGEAAAATIASDRCPSTMAPTRERFVCPRVCKAIAKEQCKALVVEKVKGKRLEAHCDDIAGIDVNSGNLPWKVVKKLKQDCDKMIEGGLEDR